MSKVQKIIAPKKISETAFETLRGIGLSNAKANYVLNVCRFFIEEKITDTKLHKLSNDELIKYLSQIKGVGQWTVEMILMFTLGREDVFALDDLGIQQGVQKPAIVSGPAKGQQITNVISRRPYLEKTRK